MVLLLLGMQLVCQASFSQYQDGLLTSHCVHLDQQLC